MRPPRLVLLAVTAFLCTVLTGCGTSADGPLVLRGDGMVLDPVDHPVWFRTAGCLRAGADAADVMVTNVTTLPRRDDGHVATLVAWGDDSQEVLGKPGSPPAIYRSVTSTSPETGPLRDCSLDVAVVLTPGADDPVVVRTVRVTYEVDGSTYTARTRLDVVLCPAGTHPQDRGCSSAASGAAGS